MMKNLQRVTLELSSKPFIDDSEATAVRVADHLFTQWLPLIREADEVAVMLWTASRHSGGKGGKFKQIHILIIVHSGIPDQKYLPFLVPNTSSPLRVRSFLLRSLMRRISGASEG